ncbi:bifunctional folylpolyglutamate synthase/dihydrofolate synthase, partial [Candidatus Woesearchaeota archaeon]|nr:bifunctional folylpolyglutamate synthase/dihydrofolate synthase [Candidatus Woesearchaeota archaeon]
MLYDKDLKYLYSLQTWGSKLGLKRTRDALKAFSNPQNDLKIIHITGTNGKGSTAAFLSQVLIDAGYKVGTFVSPY